MTFLVTDGFKRFLTLTLTRSPSLPTHLPVSRNCSTSSRSFSNTARWQLYNYLLLPWSHFYTDGNNCKTFKEWCNLLKIWQKRLPKWYTIIVWNSTEYVHGPQFQGVTNLPLGHFNKLCHMWTWIQPSMQAVTQMLIITLKRIILGILKVLFWCSDPVLQQVTSMSDTPVIPAWGLCWPGK